MTQMLRITPNRAAVVTMEMQRGVIGDVSSIPELADAVAAENIIPNTARLLDAARSVGVSVVHCLAGFRGDRAGTPLNADNVIKAFRKITEKAGLGRGWAPREMRHTFVSVLSANGVAVESIALLAGHDRTTTTELVYRHEIRPALTQGAEVMDKIFR